MNKMRAIHPAKYSMRNHDADGLVRNSKGQGELFFVMLDPFKSLHPAPNRHTFARNIPAFIRLQ